MGLSSLTTWLAALSWPIVSRILKALGIGVVTFAGAELAIDGMVSAAKTSFLGLPPEVAQLLARAGFFDALAIVIGGLVSGIAWMSLKKFAIGTTG